MFVFGDLEYLTNVCIRFIHFIGLVTLPGHYSGRYEKQINWGTVLKLSLKTGWERKGERPDNSKQWNTHAVLL